MVIKASLKRRLGAKERLETKASNSALPSRASAGDALGEDRAVAAARGSSRPNRGEELRGGKEELRGRRATAEGEWRRLHGNGGRAAVAAQEWRESDS